MTTVDPDCHYRAGLGYNSSGHTEQLRDAQEVVPSYWKVTFLFTSSEYRLSRSYQDSPYRDASPHNAPSSRSRSSGRPASPKGPQSAKLAKPHRHSTGDARSSHHEDRSAHGGTRRRSRRRRSPYSEQPQLTSHPTGRAAYADTRQWLLAQHGPVCAYCAERFSSAKMTLDHVAPRRGQKAYDRRDNLVLACPACNAAKRDMAPTAFLLARRSRAANLLRYGTHLSPMLIQLAQTLSPTELQTPVTREQLTWPSLDEDGESPYRD